MLSIPGYRGHSELVPIIAEQWKSIKYESLYTLKIPRYSYFFIIFSLYAIIHVSYKRQWSAHFIRRIKVCRLNSKLSICLLKCCNSYLSIAYSTYVLTLVHRMLIEYRPHRGEILYSRGRISSCKTVYIEFLCYVLLSVPVE